MLCESELAAWIQSKEEELKAMLSFRFSSEDMEDSSKLSEALNTNRLHNFLAQLSSKQPILEDLVQRRRELIIEHNSGPLSPDQLPRLASYLSSLVKRIEHRIQEHQRLAADTLEVSRLQSDLRYDLSKIIRQSRDTNFQSNSNVSRSHLPKVSLKML